MNPSDDRQTLENSHFVNENVYWPIHLLNKIKAFSKKYFGVPFINLNRRQIVELTRVKHIHEAFGSQAQFHRMLEIYFNEFEANPSVSAMGVIGITSSAKSYFQARRECMDYVWAHPAVLQQKIAQPVVIMGMHRTGSTLLFNLLHQDPHTRSTFMYEMYGDWPHIPSATSRAAQYTDPRMQKMKQLLDKARKFLPEGVEKLSKTHDSTYDMIEEEVIIASHEMLWLTQAPLAGAEFKKILFDADKDFIFKYLKIYLQVLQTGYAPSSHWTMKSPSHMLHIDSFMKAFPDARVVLLHRDPAVTIPSMAYLIEACWGSCWQWNTWDRRTLGPYILELYQTMTQRLMQYRDAHPETARQFVDIKFSALEADPIGQVQHIYRTFGIDYDESLTAKLQGYLASHQKHKHGKPDYSLAKYGVDAAVIQQNFAEYNARYLR